MHVCVLCCDVYVTQSMDDFWKCNSFIFAVFIPVLMERLQRNPMFKVNLYTQCVVVSYVEACESR